jgi:hypothetical protein
MTWNPMEFNSIPLLGIGMEVELKLKIQNFSIAI